MNPTEFADLVEECLLSLDYVQYALERGNYAEAADFVAVTRVDLQRIKDKLNPRRKEDDMPKTL